MINNNKNKHLLLKKMHFHSKVLMMTYPQTKIKKTKNRKKKK